MSDESTRDRRTPAEHLKTLAFTVLHDVYRLGDELGAVSLDDLAERIRRIHAGLNPQNEFQAITEWLGQATAFAIQNAGSDGTALRAPDYLLISKQNGRDLPVLVEVKTTNDEELVWTAAYLDSLSKFADLLRLPLLVAWKRHGLWTLVHSVHFALHKTAYHLPFEVAMKENLMFVLCGELFIELDEHFQFIITGEVAEPLPPKEELAPPGMYTVKLTDAGFFTTRGRITDLENECFWLFNCCEETNHIERPAQQVIKATHHPEPESTFPLSRVLLAQLAWRKDTIDWSAELHRRPFPSTGTAYTDILQRAIDVGVVRYVIQQRPYTCPDFLTATDE